MTLRIFCSRCGSWLLCAAVLATMAGAQTFMGSVVGRVTDPQHAVVVGASVTLRSVDRGFEHHATTNAQGEYFFQLVPPGKFVIVAEASGFATATANVEVVVATPVRADVVLRVQPLKQAVTVFGESGIAVQTKTGDLGRVVSLHEISELPSLTRSPYDFIALLPGATLSNDGNGVGFAVNGGRTQSANYMLDGSENNDTFQAFPGQDVPLDSIEEFSVQTNPYSAEYGHSSAFTANIVTKAGSNYFHGSLYDYIRNSALAANTYDNIAHGFPRPVFNRHQFGGTLGGPIRQRTLFFFTSVEPILVRSSTSNSFYVPTPQLLAISAPGTQAIFQRFSLPKNLSPTDVLTESICPFHSSCDSQSGAGFVTLPVFASTSRAGPQDVGAGPPQDTVLANARLDWVINPTMQGFVRYAIENSYAYATVSQPYSPQLDPTAVTGRNQNLAFDFIRNWSPHVATESRIAYSRVGGGDIPPAVPQPLIPAFSISGEPALLPSGTSVIAGPLNFYQFFQTVTWARGHHTLKLGGAFVHRRENHHFGFVGEVANANFQSTQAFVDGVLSSYSIAVDPKGHFPGQFVDPPFGPPSFVRHFRYNDPGLFVTDTWTITPRLTLTSGLRWEFFGVLHSPGAEHTLDSNFYFGSGNYLQRIANGMILRTVDAPGNLRGRFYRPDYGNFAPRLGIAYDLFGNGKTVLRAGAGIFYDRHVGWELFRVFASPPSFSWTSLTNVPVTDNLIKDQYAAFPNAPLQLTKSDTTAVDPNMRTAYTSSWNTTVEHEFRGSFVIGASYLGSSGSRLYSLYRLNVLGSGGLLDASCIATRYAADGTTPLGPNYMNCPQLNPNLSDLRLRTNGSHSSYNALQLTLDSHRLRRWGAQLGANYTWSHSMDNRSESGTTSPADVGGAFLDAFHPSLDRGPSDFDVRQRIAGHFVWEIPLGRNSQRWKGRYLLGGWEISGLLSYQTGQPFTIADTGVLGFGFERTRPRVTGFLPSVGSLVPDAVNPNSFLYLPINQVYDTSGQCIAHTVPFACQISINGPFDGSLARNAFRQPGLYFQDTALMKNLPLPREGMKLQFRAEFYNLFNHPNLYINQGTNDVNSPSFTRSAGQPAVPGVTASFQDSRQIVVALKLAF